MFKPRKIARYAFEGGIYYGVLEGEFLHRLAGDLFAEPGLAGSVDPLHSSRLLCPIAYPRIFAVGMNYVSHIAEAGHATPSIPQLFMMPSTAAVGPEDKIMLPREAEVVHHECELAVVIGRRTRRISKDQALDAVLGYTCANDVSERVIQKAEMAMGCLLVGKSFDSFCPLGPVIATGLDPTALAISTQVNGELRQNGNTGDMLFSVRDIVSYLSQAVTLLPGDIILTGTPGGVGPLAAGDVVEVTTEGIGTLRNPVAAEEK